jgi:WD40 repeat protein
MSQTVRNSSKQCVRFHPNSLYIATGSSDWTARLWDVQRGTSVRVFIGHQGIVSTLAFSPDGRYLATTGKPISTTLDFHLLNGSPLGEDLSVNLWDLGSGRRIKKMTGHTASSILTRFQCRVFVIGQRWGGLDCQVLGCQRCGRATRDIENQWHRGQSWSGTRIIRRIQARK